MFVPEISIQTQIVEVEIERTRLNDVELRKDWMIVGNREYAVLVRALDIREPKQSISTEWSAQAEAGLAAKKGWFGVEVCHGPRFLLSA